MIGDGVTIFFDSGLDGGTGPFNPSGGIILNAGNASIGAIPNGAAKFGAWTTQGSTPWTPADATGNTSWTTPTQGVGIAFYVRRPASGVTQIFNMSGTTPLMFNGVLYGPRDKVGVAGSGLQAAVGQIVAWTITYSGNTTITQTYDGPEEMKSYLLEPRTGQGD